MSPPRSNACTPSRRRQSGEWWRRGVLRIASASLAESLAALAAFAARSDPIAKALTPRNVQLLRLPRDEKGARRLLPRARLERRLVERLAGQVPRDCRAAPRLHAESRLQRVGPRPRQTGGGRRTGTILLYRLRKRARTPDRTVGGDRRATRRTPLIFDSQRNDIPPLHLPLGRIHGEERRSCFLAYFDLAVPSSSPTRCFATWSTRSEALQPTPALAPVFVARPSRSVLAPLSSAS